MRLAFLALSTLAVSAASAHPGNGIVAISADSVISGDAVGNGIWRFKKGKAPERLADEFHCHWVTRGADGRIYAENLHETGGAWESAVYRLDATGARPERMLLNRELGSLMFTATVNGSLLRQGEGGLFETRPGGGAKLWKSGELRDVSAYAWDEDSLYMADGDLVRMVSPSMPSILAFHRVRGTVVDRLYAGPNGSPKIWGLAVGPRKEVYVAVPSFSQVVRIQPDGKTSVVASGAEGWQPVGVATYGADVFVLESKTVGRENYGPRVRVIRENGRIDDLGEVKR